MSNFFKTKVNDELKEIAIVTLIPENDGIRLGSGCYVSSENRTHEWTGESIDGNIPYEALIQWALKKGYLNYIKDSRI